MTTRKERKHKRKTKATPDKKMGKLMDSFARDMGLAMTKIKRYKEEDVNKKVYCKTCSQYYCLGFCGEDIFCEDCFYNTPEPPDNNGLPFGCQKETVGGRVCQHCSQ